MFVVTDRYIPVDTEVTLRLSLPRVLAPLELRARIASHRAAGAPGELGGVVVEFDPDASRPALEALLENLTTRRPPAAPYRVLLVEDSRLTRDVFEYSAGRYFGAPGSIAIDHAENAERAWELLGSQRYDIVIADYSCRVPTEPR